MDADQDQGVGRCRQLTLHLNVLIVMNSWERSGFSLPSSQFEIKGFICFRQVLTEKTSVYVAF